MELSVSRQAVVINEMVYEGNLEQSVESDVLLPDYCPDIVKILRCFCTAKVISSQIVGDKLTVDLSCALKVYYLGNDGNIRCSEQRLPYTKSCDLKMQVQDPIVDVCCRTDYVNCRAVNQRRFEIRCAVTLECRVFSRKSEEVVCDADGAGIQLRSASSEITEIAGDVSCQFTMHEDLQLGAAKPAVQSVIRQECVARLGDYKVISGKVVVKGELMVHLLYQPDGEGMAPEIMEYSLPISQIVDVEGVDEDCQCEVELGVISGEFAPKVNLEGESRLCAMDCSLNARGRSHRRQQLQLITDCYSTEFDCHMEKVPMACMNLIKVVEETCAHKAMVDLPSDVRSVIDLFCTVADASSRYEGGEVLITAKLVYGMFCQSESGEITYHEQPEECEYKIPLEESYDSVIFAPRGAVLSCSYSMVGADKLECRADVLLCGCIYSVTRPSVAASIVCDTTKPKERECEDASLIIYYAERDEDIWDIAKRYNTSLAAVMSENSLEGGRLCEKRMLLIPVV